MDEVPEMPAADVQLVPPPHGGTVLTGSAIVIGNLCALAPLVPLALAVGLMVLGYLIGFRSGDGVPLERLLLGLGLMGVGFLLSSLSLVVSLLHAGTFGNLYLKARMRRHSAMRPGRLVRAEDPGARFIEVVPRENWHRVMLDTASDVGFLQVDTERRELLFEGDRERWRIPGAAILSCAPEPLTVGGGMKYYMITLRANHPEGNWERPFGLRGATGVFPGKRQRKTQELHAEILSIMPQTQQPEQGGAAPPV